MEENGRKSLFNAGVAMTERIDELQRTFNMARFNPLLFNIQFSRFNYEIMISSQDGLLDECWAKLSTKEREKGDKIKKLINEFVQRNKIIKQNSNGEMIINGENFQKFMILIDIYSKNNKILLDSHNLNSPDSDEDDEL
jgi:hypothetical protein